MSRFDAVVAVLIIYVVLFVFVGAAARAVTQLFLIGWHLFGLV